MPSFHITLTRQSQPLLPELQVVIDPKSFSQYDAIRPLLPPQPTAPLNPSQLLLSPPHLPQLPPELMHQSILQQAAPAPLHPQHTSLLLNHLHPPQLPYVPPHNHAAPRADTNPGLQPGHLALRMAGMASSLVSDMAYNLSRGLLLLLWL